MKTSIFLAAILLYLLPADMTGQRDAPRFNYELQKDVYLNTVTLGLFHERTDYQLPGIGQGLDFTFYYNSTNLDLGYGFGMGWSFTYNWQYEVDLSGPQPIFTLHRGDGSVDEFTFLPGGWVSPTGVYDLLEEYLPGKYRLTGKHGTLYFFDEASHRRLTSIVDKNGNTTSLTYTGGLPTLVTDPAGRSITLSYTDDRLTELRNGFIAPNHVITYTYDTGGRLTTTVDTEGNTTEYDYDEDGMSGISSPGGSMFTRKGKGGKTKKTKNQKTQQEIEEDNAKKQVKIIEGLTLKREIVFARDTCNRIKTIKRGCCGGEKHLEYDVNNNISKLTDADGNVATYTYDGKGNRTGKSSPSGAVEAWTFEPIYNLPLSYTDPRGNAVSYAYDGNGNRVSSTFPTHSTTNTYNAAGQLTASTNGRGNTTSYTYNAAGYLTTTTDALGQATVFTVDAVGNITSVTDPKGNSIGYVYDTKRNITQFTDAAGNASSFTYDSRGNQTSIVAPDGNTTSFTYDAFDRLVSEVSPGGRVETWEYDAFDNVIRQTDPMGHETRFEYDGAGHLVRQTDALGYNTEFEYDSRGNVVSQTQADGATILYVYDGMNRQISNTDAQGNTKSRTYDLAGNISTTTDANGNTTAFGYDILNRLELVTSPLGHSTSYHYDANSNVVRTDDALGGTSTMTYDALDRLVTLTDPLGSTSAYTYDAGSYLIGITNALGHTLTQVYDDRGLVIAETNAAGALTTNSYDAIGNLIATTQPNGRTVNYTFGQDYQLLAIGDGDGTVVSFTYDLNGNLLTESNGLNQVILIADYDALDRVVEETDAEGNSSTYMYDANDNVVRATSKNNATLDYIYDERNLLFGEINQENDTLLYVRDNNGNIIEEIDENANSTLYTYDAENRQTGITYPDGSSATTLYDALSNPISETRPDGSISNYTYDAIGQLLMADHPGLNDDAYTYNALGQLTAAANPAAAMTFTYDPVGRVLSEVLNGKTTAYAYDDGLNELTLTYPGGRSIVQNLDQRGRLEDVREAGSPLVTHTYDAADRLSSSTYTNGVSTVLTYDPGQRPASLNHNGPGGLLAGFNFGYNQNGQLTAKDFLHRPQDSERLWYDANDRLARQHKGPVFADAIPTPTRREAFVYDGSGNRTFDQLDDEVRTLSTNTSNQYLTSTVGGASASILHDANGNLTDDAVNAYVFDTKNRLISSSGTATVSYLYDPLGRRISQTVDGTITNYFYDGNRVIEERNAADAVAATYVYGKDLDDVISMQRSGTDYFFHKDQQGNTVLATDATATVVERYDYTAFGKPQFQAADFSPLPSSTIGNPYLFTGRRYDEATGLYYYRERYYHPDLGRFLGRDPLGSLDGSNQYAYVGNDPANALDPLGTLKYFSRWTPIRHPLKWDELGTDFTRTKGKTKTKYLKKDCCCIEASCDEFNLTTTTRFQAYQKFIKTNPRWIEMHRKVINKFKSLQSDLINISELTDILNEGNEESFGLKAAAQDGIGLGLNLPGSGTIAKIATGDSPDLATGITDGVGYAVGVGATKAITAGLITTTAGTSAVAAGGSVGLALAVGLTIGTKLKQAWTLWGISSEIKEKVKKAEAKARALKKMVDEFSRIEPYLQKYEKRTRSESNTLRQKENFRARQVPLAKCK